MLAPAHQLPEGPGADDKTPLPDLVAPSLDGDGSMRGLVEIDPDGDHAHPDLALEAAEVCGGHPDLK
jgi:hypothetical protein